MAAKHQKIDIRIPVDYKPLERQAIALEVIKTIVKRTQDKQVDKNGRPFPIYSSAYTKSLDFKIAGKSKNNINLTLSGDMLAALDLIADAKGKITIGYEKGSAENGKADGNIRGTYGKDRGSKAKARDFLGISKDELAAILDKYPLDDPEKSMTRAGIKQVIKDLSADIAADIEGDNG